MPRNRWTTPGIRLPRIPTGAFLMGEADREDARRLEDTAHVTAEDIRDQLRRRTPRVEEIFRASDTGSEPWRLTVRYLRIALDTATESLSLTEAERKEVLRATRAL